MENIFSYVSASSHFNYLTKENFNFESLTEWYFYFNHKYMMSILSQPTDFYCIFLQVTPKPFTTLLSQKISPFIIIVLYSPKLSHKQLLYTSTHRFFTAPL